MKRAVHIAVNIKIAAPVNVVWQRLTDWKSQGEWMLFTRVTASKENLADNQIGNLITAFSGFKIFRKFRFGLLDQMRVTKWEANRLCEVDHYGKWLKGFGRFELITLAANKCQLNWYERIDSPFFLSLLTKPFTKMAVYISLVRFRRKFSNH